MSGSKGGGACGGNPKTLVKDIASFFKEEAKTNSSSGGGAGYHGKGELHGELEKAQFKSGKTLGKDEICKLDKTKHTNDKRSENERTEGPCQGKDGKKMNQECMKRKYDIDKKNNVNKKYNVSNEYYKHFKKETEQHITADTYLKSKCKPNDNNCQCENMKDEEMDKIVSKTDELYKKKYEPLCTFCKIERIKKKVEKSKKKPSDICSSKNSNISEELCKVINIPMDPKTKNSDRNNDESGHNCGGIPSDTSQIEWKNREHNDLKHLNDMDKRMYVSTRRQKFCVHELDKASSIYDLTNKLLTVAANQGYNLAMKYNDYKETYGVEPCNALKYSFYDYQHIILGDDPLEPDTNPTEKKLKELFKKMLGSNSQEENKLKEKRKEIWNQNKKCVWNAMKCGYEKGKKKAEEKGKNVPDIKSICDIPTEFDNTDQFLVWLTEWYEDYCNIGNKLKSDVENNCKGNGQNFNCKTCPTSCNKYKEYMKKKKEEWEDQKKYYSEKKGSTGVKNNGYTEQDATEYLKNKFTVTCGDQQKSGTNTVETNIDALQQTPKYDVEDHCGCTKYIEENDYKTISNKSNCWGLQNKATNTKPEKEIKWRNNEDSGCNYLKRYPFDKDLISPNVYLPPRKQNLCFHGLDGQGNGVINEEKLIKHLLKVAATEGYNLGQYYKEKKKSGGKDKDKYNYDVSPCNAMKYSFLDLRDIILGHDMTEPKDWGTENNLKKILENGGDGKPGNQQRKEWWKQNQKCVWEAMKCGYRKGRDDGSPSGTTKPSDEELKSCDNFPSETEYPIGDNRESGKNLQFMRWFAEWGEDFCQKQTRELDTLQQKCKDCNSHGNCGSCNDCKTACEAYRKFIKPWKDQYEKQKTKFDTDKTDSKIKQAHPDIDKKKAYEFISEKCMNGSCKCMETPSTTSQNSGKDMPKSLEEKPESVKDKCQCSATSPPKPMPNPNPNHPSSSGDSGSSTPVAQQTPQCKIDEYISENEGKKQRREAGGCNAKTGPFNWDCSPGKFKTGNEGACMPPRRQKLCIHYIQHMNNGANNKEEELKKALLQSVSLETYWLWQKYKETHTNADTELKKGNIPPEFKRQMFYTYSDFRDLILNKDIGKNEGNVAATRTKIDNALKNGKPPGGTPTEPSEWWNGVAEDIWKGMLCALTHSTIGGSKDITTKDDYNYSNVKFDGPSGTVSLASFAARPQFLRWMTEWGEHYCREHKVEFGKLEAGCKDYTCGSINGNKGKCEGACKKYKQFIDKWKPNYESQKTKYASVKEQQEYTSKDSDVSSSSEAYEYLYKKIEKICNGGTNSGNSISCDCMKTKSTTQSGDMPASLDEKPKSIKSKCDCAKPVAPNNSHGQTMDPKQPPSTGPGHTSSQTTNTPGPDTNGSSSGNQAGGQKPATKRQTPSSGGQNPADPDGSPDPSGQSNSSGTGSSSNPNPGSNGTADTNAPGPAKPGSVDQDSGTSNGPVNVPVPSAPGGTGDPKTPKDEFKKLDTCPQDNAICSSYKSSLCKPKNIINELDNWKNNLVKDNTRSNKGVLVPPRRRNMCFKDIIHQWYRIKEEEHFKKRLLVTAATEAKMLIEHYKDPIKSLEAIKYSFADIGNIVKGNDMLEDGKSDKIKEIFERINHQSLSKQIDAIVWWEKNKKYVWNAMMCHYIDNKKDPPMCPKYESIDEVPQYLRWLEEWARIFCYEEKKEAKALLEKCENDISNNIAPSDCNKILKKYKNWFNNRYVQWKGLSEKYTREKETLKNHNIKESTAQAYIQTKCPECDCNYGDLEYRYNRIREKPKNINDILFEKAKIDRFDPSKSKFSKFFTFGKYASDIVKDASKALPGIVSFEIKKTLKNIFDPNSIGDIVLGKIKDFLTISEPNNQNTDPSRGGGATRPAPPSPAPPPQPGGSNPTQNDQPINTDILNTTLPVGISFALGSIALLFYMKKKPILRPTKLFRVLDIPQNDYGIPDKTSTNRYVPYGKYKGKTYIYVEGEETDDYVRDISSSDITSSSESEYEEVDINDIYPYKSPKYKTLIEVVLKPSTNNNVQDTYTDDVKDNSDKPINKLTDEEWNELKQDFISQYLQNIPKDLPNENIIDDNMYKDTQPNILDVSNEEKPFITSIQDRKLYSDNEIIYNIDWNVPENITTNNVDIPKYVTSNDKYSGIDLINDSLNSGNDIYDELLKRKENELFGTEHPKHTSTNSVAKQIGGDPILNQLVLFDKWLDRHRDMCNKWNNKEEMLNQLNEEWKNENNEHVLYTSTIDDINRINDKNYNIISTNNLYDDSNIKTPLDNHGSTNIPPNDLITQNNGSQTKNLSTNISMDIHMDENNNNVNNEDDKLENMYYF
ncbi:erythrocyte membrane protein 1 (PfEMP1), putative [Plasmodium sp. DRC-Itaito]|nr:erythrocyte membrane protein 1 (PfEMP1), putative [Plasmodium sp. DRC-Itaito]